MDNFHYRRLGGAFGAGFAGDLGTEPVCAGVEGFTSAGFGFSSAVAAFASPGLDFSSAVDGVASAGFDFPSAVEGFPSGAAFASLATGSSRQVLKRVSSPAPFAFHHASSKRSALRKLSGAVGKLDEIEDTGGLLREAFPT